MFWKILVQFMKQKIQEIGSFLIKFICICIYVIPFFGIIVGSGYVTYKLFPKSNLVVSTINNPNCVQFMDKIVAIGMFQFAGLISIIVTLFGIVCFFKWLFYNWKDAVREVKLKERN